VLGPQPCYSEPVYPLNYFIFPCVQLALPLQKGKGSSYVLALTSDLFLSMRRITSPDSVYIIARQLFHGSFITNHIAPARPQDK